MTHIDFNNNHFNFTNKNTLFVLKLILCLTLLILVYLKASSNIHQSKANLTDPEIIPAHSTSSESVSSDEYVSSSIYVTDSGISNIHGCYLKEFIDRIVFNKTVYDKNDVTITLNEVGMYKVNYYSNDDFDAILLEYNVQNNSDAKAYIYCNYLLFNDYQVNDVYIEDSDCQHYIEGHTTTTFYSLVSTSPFFEADAWYELGISVDARFEDHYNYERIPEDNFTSCQLYYPFDDNHAYSPEFIDCNIENERLIASTDAYDIYFINYKEIHGEPSARLQLLLRSKANYSIDFQFFNLCYDDVPQNNYYELENTILSPNCITYFNLVPLLDCSDSTRSTPIDVKFNLIANDLGQTIHFQTEGILVSCQNTRTGYIYTYK